LIWDNHSSIVVKTNDTALVVKLERKRTRKEGR
jgi:hypothetical protein